MKATRTDIVFIALVATVTGLLLGGGAMIFVASMILKLSTMMKLGSFVACVIGFLLATVCDSEINKYFPMKRDKENGDETTEMGG